MYTEKSTQGLKKHQKPVVIKKCKGKKMTEGGKKKTLKSKIKSQCDENQVKNFKMFSFYDSSM